MVNGNKCGSSFSAQKILLFSVLSLFISTLGHSDPVEDKTMNRNGLTAIKQFNVSLNSILNNKISRKRQSKSLEKVRKRKKKSGSYYPIRDKQSVSVNSISSLAKAPGSEKEENKLKNNQNLTEANIDNNLEITIKTNTSQEDNEQIIPIKLNLEYVDVNRDTRDDASIKDDLLTSPAVVYNETSRSLQSARQQSVRGLENFITTRTSSRTLFPPHRRTYSVTSSSSSPTPHPTSFFTAKTPEFNHVSFLTHPSKVTSARDNNRKSFQDDHFQTNFGEELIRVVDDLSLGNTGEKTTIRDSRIPKNSFKSFFTLGAPRETNPTTTTTTTTTPTTIKPKSFQEKDFQVNPWNRDAFHTEVF